jgi:hypothetical protein
MVGVFMSRIYRIACSSITLEGNCLSFQVIEGTIRDFRIFKGFNAANGVKVHFINP